MPGQTIQTILPSNRLNRLTWHPFTAGRTGPQPPARRVWRCAEAVYSQL